MVPPVTVAFHTLGCKLNFSETSELSRSLVRAGMKLVPFTERADVYVINSCSVTENADKECRMLVRRVRRQAPHSKVVVVGCYAQLQPEAVAAIQGVDLVLGHAEKFRLAEYLISLTADGLERKIFASDVRADKHFASSSSLGERTRSFLKVQDGCNYHCTFCTIPLARGPSRSAPLHEFVAQARKLGEAGIQEIVLTGVNVGDVGIVDGRRQFHLQELLEALLEETAIPRYRISSIEPNLLTDALIDLIASTPRLMPHVHIPLQSGCDRILALMRRRYRTDFYADRIRAIRTKIPHCCIGADVITGFPGESDQDFEQTSMFLRTIDVNYLHVFTYSERLNTEAIQLPGGVAMEQRRERTRQLRMLSQKKRALFYAAHRQTVRPVLFEKLHDDGLWEGYTDNFIRVRAANAQEGLCANVRLNAVYPDYMSGEVLDAPAHWHPTEPRFTLC